MNRKVSDFLDAGVSLVWVINPDVKRVQVYRADGSGALLAEKDHLSGENVLPGFTCPIADLFVLPQNPKP